MSESSDHEVTFLSRADGILGKLFKGSCSRDPKGSVHRAWGFCMFAVVAYLVVVVIEIINISKAEGGLGSAFLIGVASVSGIAHIILLAVGTFVLKRFPTTFTVGFLLGILLIVANQNLILFGRFHGYAYGKTAKNRAFGAMCLILSISFIFFSVLLFHFKRHIIVAPIDAAGFGRQNRRTTSS